LVLSKNATLLVYKVDPEAIRRRPVKSWAAQESIDRQVHLHRAVQRRRLRI